MMGKSHNPAPGYGFCIFPNYSQVYVISTIESLFQSIITITYIIDKIFDNIFL